MTDKRKVQPLPQYYTLLAGGFAGVTEIAMLYPLDSVKTRMQLEVGKGSTMVGMLKDIVTKEGYGRLYRGIMVPICIEAPKRAIKFGANDFWGKTYKKWSGQSAMTQSLALATGCSAGATESLIVVPTELIKIRLQDKNSKFTGPMDVVKKTVRTQGITGMFSGMEATFWRHVFWNGGYFGSIFQIRSLMPKAETSSGNLLNNFIAGTLSGTIGTVLNTPIDVAKSRIQGSTTTQKVWTFPSLISIAKNEGASALFKGFVPKCCRLGPGGGIMLLVVDFTLEQIRKIKGPPYI